MAQENNQENEIPPEDEEMEQKETIFNIVQNFFKNYGLHKSSSKTHLIEKKDQNTVKGKNEMINAPTRIDRADNRNPNNNFNARNVLTENSINTRRGKTTYWNCRKRTSANSVESATSDRRSLSPRNHGFQEHNSNSRNLNARGCVPSSEQQGNTKSLSPKNREFQELNSNSGQLNARDGVPSLEQPGNETNNTARGHVTSTRDLILFSADASIRNITERKQNQTIFHREASNCKLPWKSDIGVRNSANSSENNNLLENLQDLSISASSGEQNSDRLICRRQIGLNSQSEGRPEWNNLSSNRDTIKPDFRLMNYILCNLRKLTIFNLQSGGLIFWNSQGLNVSFAEFKPDMNHIVYSNSNCIEVVNVGLMSGGTVILEKESDEFGTPNYYAENPVVVEKHLQPMEKPGNYTLATNSLVPIKLQALSPTNGGGIVEDPTQDLKPVLAELFPSTIAPQPPAGTSSPSANSISGGRLVIPKAEEKIILDLSGNCEHYLPDYLCTGREDGQGYVEMNGDILMQNGIEQEYIDQGEDEETGIKIVEVNNLMHLG